MATNKLQWKRIAKGDKLPCQSFLRKKNGEILKLSTGAGVTVGQDAYYLPVDDVIEEIRNYPIEETKDERVIEYFKELAPFYNAEELYDKYGFSHKDAIAWLEKKCEQKLYVNDNAKEMFIKALERVEEQNNKGYKLTDCDKNSWWEDFKAYTSCIIEQKPADKPKFHKGDWVVYCNDDVDLITGVEENGYCINNSGYIPFICASDVRLWTIEDAKDGDVLVSESNCGLGTWYCIFKSLDDDESMTVYCYLARDGRFETKKELCFDKDPFNTKPATKEQRDTLMKAMADAGYAFDFKKKELKKIEQKPVKVPKFKVGDFIQFKGMGHTRYTVKEVCGLSHYINTCNKRMDMSYTDANFELVEQKPTEWSEEDEQLYNDLSDTYFYNDEDYPEETYKLMLKRVLDWMIKRAKSLRPQSQWKPSDEHYELEEFAKIVRGNLTGISKAVQKLFEAKYLQLTGNKMYGGFKD